MVRAEVLWAQRVALRHMLVSLTARPEECEMKPDSGGWWSSEGQFGPHTIWATEAEILVNTALGYQPPGTDLCLMELRP